MHRDIEDPNQPRPYVPGKKHLTIRSRKKPSLRGLTSILGPPMSVHWIS